MISALRLLAVASLALPLCACAHKAPGGSYLVVVRDPGTTRPVEGATVELVPGDAARASAVTDGKGEAVLLVRSFSRAELRVEFDGEVDRHFVRAGSIPRWGAPVDDQPDPAARGPLVFLPDPAAGTAPRFASELFFLRTEPPR
jgi:hypothetical protein